MSRGGRLNCTRISMPFTGRHLPARTRNGTPSQRQLSTCSLTAAKVSTVESRATPGWSRYPRNCPRTTCSGWCGERRVQRPIERPRRGETAPEWLFDGDASGPGTVRPRQALDHRGEGAGRDRQIVQRTLGCAELAAQALERGAVGVIAVDVAQERDQLVERRAGE